MRGATQRSAILARRFLLLFLPLLALLIPHAFAAPIITRDFTFVYNRPSDDIFGVTGLRLHTEVRATDVGGTAALTGAGAGASVRSSNPSFLFAQPFNVPFETSVTVTGGAAFVRNRPITPTDFSRIAGMYEYTVTNTSGQSTTVQTHVLDKLARIPHPTNLSLSNQSTTPTFTFTDPNPVPEIANLARRYELAILNDQRQFITWLPVSSTPSFQIPADLLTAGQQYYLRAGSIDFDLTEGAPFARPAENMAIAYTRFVPSVPRGGRDLSSEIRRDRPTVVVTHGVQPDTKYVEGLFPSTAQGIVDRIRSQYGTSVNVIPFHWKEAYRTTPNLAQAFEEARPFLENAGSQLGDLLVSKLGADYAEPIQFIGHSAGTLLNAFAARDFLKRSSASISQFTILDAPLDYTSYGPDFFYPLLPDYPKVKWVDNYYGVFGVGDELKGAYNDSLLRGHTGVAEWYKETIESNPNDGFRYSVLRGASEFANRPEPQRWYGPRERKVISLIDGITDADLDYMDGCGITGRYGVLPVYRCTENSPASMVFTLSVPHDAEILSFDYLFDNQGDGDWLSVFFDSILLFSFSGQNFWGDSFVHTDIPIAAFAGMTGTLQFYLNSVGDPNASFDIANLGFFRVNGVPEPSPLSLICFLAAVLLVKRENRDQMKRPRRSRSRSSRSPVPACAYP